MFGPTEGNSSEPEEGGRVVDSRFKNVVNVVFESWILEYSCFCDRVFFFFRLRIVNFHLHVSDMDLSLFLLDSLCAY
uniref:Uncharacterized protein n=1 Tax=Noccaea caerulescens TaxID=107243 RepID=A0A1J3JHM1_NOCCA